MEFAYLDESGDLGSEGSRSLVLALMCTRRKKEIATIIREAKKRLLDHNKTARWLNRKGEIKFYSFPDKDLLKRVLRKLAQVEMNIYFIVFEKNGTGVGPEIKQYILTHLFRHLMKRPQNKIEKVVADLSFFNHEKYNRFILRAYTLKELVMKNEHGLDVLGETGEVTYSKLSDEEFEKIKLNHSSTIVEIEHCNSRLSEELQALDLISGSIFQLAEYHNKEYLDILGKGKARIQGGNFH